MHTGSVNIHTCDASSVVRARHNLNTKKRTTFFSSLFFFSSLVLSRRKEYARFHGFQGAENCEKEEAVSLEKRAFLCRVHASVRSVCTSILYTETERGSFGNAQLAYQERGHGTAYRVSSSAAFNATSSSHESRSYLYVREICLMIYYGDWAKGTYIVLIKISSE